MSIVKNKAHKILSSALIDVSKKEKSKVMEVQLLVKYYKGSPSFFALKDYKNDLGHLPLRDLYPSWKDVFGIRDQIPVFLANLINDISAESSVAEEDVILIISPIDEKATKLFVTAYKDGKILKNMTWQEVFGEEAMMRMMAKQ